MYYALQDVHIGSKNIENIQEWSNARKIEKRAGGCPPALALFVIVNLLFPALQQCHLTSEARCPHLRCQSVRKWIPVYQKNLAFFRLSECRRKNHSCGNYLYIRQLYFLPYELPPYNVNRTILMHSVYYNILCVSIEKM